MYPFRIERLLGKKKDTAIEQLDFIFIFERIFWIAYYKECHPIPVLARPIHNFHLIPVLYPMLSACSVLPQSRPSSRIKQILGSSSYIMSKLVILLYHIISDHIIPEHRSRSHSP